MIRINKKEKDNNGITLIVLVITIIILLILAGVTIATLTGDNGILTKATEARNKTKTAEEKEKIELALTGALAKDNGGKVKEEYLNEELANQFGERGIDYKLEGAKPFMVTIIKSGRSYIINEDSTIEEVVKREKIKIGDYVNYTPDVSSPEYSESKLGEDITGTNRNSTILQEDLKWRILNIERNGRVDLISDTLTSQYLYFYGARGYNNGVYVMNDLCKELYSNNSLGIEARALDLEDIENQMNSEGKAAKEEYVRDIKYGAARTYKSGHNYYPNLYAKENGSGINTEEVKKDGIGVNADGYSSPTTEDSSIAEIGLTATQTDYAINVSSSYFDNKEFYNMVFETDANYWFASRRVTCLLENAYFGLGYVNNSSLKSSSMLRSDGYTYLERYRFRPVVSLGANIKIVSVENADGSNESNMHQISKK